MKVEYDDVTNVATLVPDGRLSKEDFTDASSQLDPVIEEKGKLAGLVICSQSFPGWESLGAMIQHLRFVHDHHRKVARVALVTDSSLGDIAEKVGRHFVAAQVRHFDYDDLPSARDWLIS
ncbi:MAG: STAS/SEC14 domain-containing protein [Alcanivorax sp.]|nr:STAS/SEC14 domain-containing protein [Alcanivorax sp.]